MATALAPVGLRASTTLGLFFKPDGMWDDGYGFFLSILFSQVGPFQRSRLAFLHLDHALRYLAFLFHKNYLKTRCFAELSACVLSR